MLTHTSHLPDFFGRGRTPLEYDRLALERIKPALLEIDQSLMSTRWWDYRPLHTVEATYLFIHTYGLIYKEAWARDVDAGEAARDEVRGYKQHDQILDTDTTIANGWWRARQAADAIGARYSVFIRSIFTHARDNGWKEYPRPDQLHSEAHLEIAVAAWDAECEAYLQIPESPLFRAGSTFWSKADFDDTLVKAMHARGNFEFSLPRFIERGIFSQEEVDAAVKRTRTVITRE
jgi:hypothetical protein